MASSWQPNINAKPFVPSSAAYVFRLPCCAHPFKIKRRGIFGRLLQLVLFSVLIVTVVFNVMFIIDSSKRFRSTDQNSPYPYDDNDEIVDANIMLEQKEKVEEPTGKMINIEARSSKELVYVAIDGVRVYENAIEGDSSRGLHIIVLSEHTGDIMAKRIFDTYAQLLDDEILLFLKILQEGRIVIFLVKDEGSMHLKKVGRNAIASFGSKFINQVRWRDHWAYICQKQKKWLAEAFQKNPAFDKWPSPAIAQISLLLSDKSTSCNYGEGDTAKRRKEFCDKYEGYRSVCTCNDPVPIDLQAEKLPGNKVTDLPVAIIASNRPMYLYRMLRGLLTVPGADAKMMTVYIDGFFNEPAAVCKLLNVRAVQHTPICSKNCRIGQHYKRSLTTTFDKYPNAKGIIILEEDLDVSKDIFDYFSQTMPLLEKDPSLYCVSAWNDQGYEHTSYDPSLLYRVETMPGLGWILKRSLYKDELEEKWPTANDYWDWDMWMRMDSNRKGRECIIPDISRTYHFGMKGLNMNPFFQEFYFSKHALNKETGIKFNTTKVYKDNYEKEMHNLVKNAEPLDHSKNQCTHKDDFVPNTKGKTYVVYIRMETRTSWDTWSGFARCFKIWDLDVRGFHNGMWRLWFKGNHIIFVGVPFSPYAIHKPKNIIPIYIPKEKKNKDK